MCLLCVKQPSAETATELTHVFIAATTPSHAHAERGTTQEDTAAKFTISLAVGFSQKFEKYCLHFSVHVVQGSALGVTWELVNCPLASCLDLYQLTFRKSLG